MEEKSTGRSWADFVSVYSLTVLATSLFLRKDELEGIEKERWHSRSAMPPFDY